MCQIRQPLSLTTLRRRVVHVGLIVLMVVSVLWGVGCLLAGLYLGARFLFPFLPFL